MILLRKSVVVFGAVATATLVFALTAPRTVRAFGEELVRIGNTETYPAIVEEVPHFASHIVTIYAYAAGSGTTGTGGGYFAPVGTDGTINWNTAFSVPAGQSFVITGVDINPGFPSTTPSYVTVINANNALTLYGEWTVQSNLTTDIQYASGIVVQSGTFLWLNAPNGVGVFLHGYWTAA
jgi:hypothetical protein